MTDTDSGTRTGGTQQRRYALAVLFGLNFMNFYDRQVIAAVGEKIRIEWALSDAQLASLTTAFVLLYALVGIPFGRLADTGPRKRILAAGVVVWSAFTALSGAAGSYATHFLFRMGVGVGEASLAPTANALIADLFPPAQRGRALSIFMLGLPLGLGASYLISGMVVQATGGWRPALYVAAVPGLVLALLVLFLREPPRAASAKLTNAVAADSTAAARTSADSTAAGRTAADTTAASVRAILAAPAMRWVIVSGAVVNLVLYAVSAFATSYYLRYHGVDIAVANRFNALVFGLGGGVGMLLGGWLGDRAGARGPSARLRLAAIGAGLAAPMLWLAVAQPRGSAWGFALCLFAAVCCIYLYYSTVYAAIHELVPPTVRGTAMSVYFFVFYVFTAIGLLLFGWLSDAMAAKALRAGATLVESKALGLHDALAILPLLCVALVGVLLLAARSAAAQMTVRYPVRVPSTE
jgi:MFS family permease